MTSQEVLDAYNVVFTAEQEIAADLTTAVELFQAKLNEFRQRLPDQGYTSMVGQCLTMVQSNMSMSWQPSFDGIKQYYALVPSSPTV